MHQSGRICGETYLEFDPRLRPRKRNGDMEEDIPKLIRSYQLEVFKSGSRISQFHDQKLGVVQISTRRRVELQSIGILPLDLLMKSLVRLQ
jgi:hypothetical protein